MACAGTILCVVWKQAQEKETYIYYHKVLWKRAFMEERKKAITGTCNFSGMRPITVDLPYPEIKISEKNKSYANVLTQDYCGSVSEMSAIVQYIYNENRMMVEHCPIAKTVLGIAMAEMMHLQMLGQLIILLGGDIDFTIRQRNGARKMWTPEYIETSECINNMLCRSMEEERNAITQYRKHIHMINDDCINKVLERIILDEEYHIMILKSLMSE